MHVEHLRGLSESLRIERSVKSPLPLFLPRIASERVMVIRVAQAATVTVLAGGLIR